MFELLTDYIPQINTAQIGEWIIDKESDGTLENPKQLPFVIYDPVIRKLEEDIYAFVETHEKMNLRSYGEILEQHGISWGIDSMEAADVSTLDGKTVMALLVGAIRAERFCDGALYTFCEKGCIKKWLERLKEIDEKGLDTVKTERCEK